MTKFWTPGQVKTRLAATVGNRRSAALHAAFVGHLCSSLNEYPARKSICLTPWNQRTHVEDFLRNHDSDGWSIIPQAKGDLGNRICDWFAKSLVKPIEIAILIGSDCPTLSAGHLNQAISLLKEHDVVLGPAVDGGYYLIGLTGNWKDRAESFEKLFEDITWSSDQVMQETCHRAREGGLTVGRLGTNEDIDTIEELHRLQRKIASLRPSESNRPLQQLAVKMDSIMNDLAACEANRAPDDLSQP